MSILYYFLLSSLIGSCVIAGWHSITRGKYEKMPDGSEKYTGMIFKGWSKFWEGYYISFSRNGPDSASIYMHQGLQNLYSAIESALGMVNSYISDKGMSIDVTCKEHPNDIYFPNAQSFDYFKKNYWRFSINNPDVYYTIIRENDNGSVYVGFKKLNRIYRFHELIRKPISSCIYCYGSIYGTAIWILLYLVAGKEYTIEQMILLWVPYCLTVSITAPKIWKGI